MVDFEIVPGFAMNGTPTDGIVLITDESLECPFCHKSIVTQPLSYIEFDSNNLQVFLKCKSCKNSFIGYTTKDGDRRYRIYKLSKGNHKTTKFDKEISEQFPSFIQIFGEAEWAEQENLMEICGVGYRKALEFLIKDYLISIKPKNEKLIKRKFLGNCIKEDIDNSKIKQIAEKATWLGNDETHYVRIWEDKDLNDLKQLINITVHYILMELQSNKYIDEMIDKK